MIRFPSISLSLAVPALCFSLLGGGLAAAEETATLPLASELTSRIGWTPEEAYTWLGAPDSIFPFRGTEAPEDNVVFYYPDHLYLFWFKDRVWQVRADGRWEGVIDGVRMGMTLEQIVAQWGKPINDFDSEPTWTLPDRGYPVRIRLYFDGSGRLHDIYIFRSDW